MFDAVDQRLGQMVTADNMFDGGGNINDSSYGPSHFPPSMTP